MTCTYRGHGHAIAKGLDPKEGMAELLGRATGCSKGKGGSMHWTDPSIGLLGENAIVGAGAPIAVGRGLFRQARRFRPGGDDLFRRWRHQPGRVPGGAESGRGLASAGDLLLREQPLLGDDADRGHDRHRNAGRAR